MSKYKPKISYTQYSKFKSCPRSWKLTYIDKLGKFTDSVNSIFGSAVHNTLQNYITVAFKYNKKTAEKIEIDKMFLDAFKTEYTQSRLKAMELGETFIISDIEYNDYAESGVEIANYFKKHFTKYFSVRNEELIGIEVSVESELYENSPLITSYLDIVTRNKKTNFIRIIDLKTSKMGWNKFQKADKLKRAQLVLYKYLYAKKFNHPLEKIILEYIILKRKLPESEFPIKRISPFGVPSGKKIVKDTIYDIRTFFNYVFKPDGNFDETKYYEAITSFGCKYCPFDNETDCPKELRK